MTKTERAEAIKKEQTDRLLLMLGTAQRPMYASELTAKSIEDGGRKIAKSVIGRRLDGHPYVEWSGPKNDRTWRLR